LGSTEEIEKEKEIHGKYIAIVTDFIFRNTIYFSEIGSIILF
jgi:hypothetical protein